MQYISMYIYTHNYRKTYMILSVYIYICFHTHAVQHMCVCSYACTHVCHVPAHGSGSAFANVRACLLIVAQSLMFAYVCVCRTADILLYIYILYQCLKRSRSWSPCRLHGFIACTVVLGLFMSVPMGSFVFFVACLQLQLLDVLRVCFE